jgi:hypothetical protein
MRRPRRQFLPVIVLLGLLAVPAATALPEEFAPEINYTLEGVPGNNGWWRSQVVIHWSVTPQQGLVWTSGCEPADPVEVETAGETRTCAARWSDGTELSRPTHPAIKIDWTPPTGLRVRRGRPPDAYGWYGHQVSFFSSGRDALSRIDRCPTKTYRRPNDATASVTALCRDRAGNVTKRTVNFKYRRPLLSPPAGRRTWRPPLLDWIDVNNARFYNIQLWHDGKALSKFREGSRFQVPRAWWQNGVRRRLEPGRYQVYVWPRFSGRYGREALRTWFVKR